MIDKNNENNENEKDKKLNEFLDQFNDDGSKVADNGNYHRL